MRKDRTPLEQFAQNMYKEINVLRAKGVPYSQIIGLLGTAVTVCAMRYDTEAFIEQAKKATTHVKDKKKVHSKVSDENTDTPEVFPFRKRGGDPS